MVQPFSIAASALAVAGAAGQGGKGLEKVWSLRDAPKELLAQLSEVRYGVLRTLHPQYSTWHRQPSPHWGAKGPTNFEYVQRLSFYSFENCGLVCEG